MRAERPSAGLFAARELIERLSKAGRVGTAHRREPGYCGGPCPRYKC